jgi:hypothetical protein
MMPASTATTLAKAQQLLGSGRVHVTQCDDVTGIFVAAVHGDSGSHTVFRGCSSAPWHCDCPAGLRGLPCSHQTATALVAGP